MNIKKRIRKSANQSESETDESQNLSVLSGHLPLPNLNPDCPQSSAKGSSAPIGSSSSSSGSSTSDCSISNSHRLEMSIKPSTEGTGIDVLAKYGMTLNAATGQSKTDPSNSAKMYAPPLFLLTTMTGPRYQARILRFKAFSIAVFQMSTRSPVLKSKSQIVCAWSFSNWTAALSHA